MNTYYYNISDKGAAIKEIKKYLYLVSQNLYPDISRITIDEFFDSETKNAIIQYQNIKGIQSTGAVDYETFSRLYRDYLLLETDLNTPDYILSEVFPLKEGDISEDVRVVHLIINELSKTFVNIPNVDNGKYYSAETRKAVLALRELFDMELHDYIDKPLYSRMKKELNARRLADGIY